ncbi:polymorphic toxin type 44 domain-containing protein [Paenibacillus sp. FA6]|uniref:polymorphic toxin type 44 domain-containing protein n=1 Tax=Paenibacillus sp. FA6 TaxID=3413029 RepID=UPI003F658236
MKKILFGVAFVLLSTLSFVQNADASTGLDASTVIEVSTNIETLGEVGTNAVGPPPPGSTNITTSFTQIMHNNKATVNAKKSEFLNACILTAPTAPSVCFNSLLNGYFVGQVKSGGPWDYKQYYKGNYSFNGYWYTGEDLGNMHFGYIGRAFGYSATTLKAGAGIYQIISGTSNSSWANSYFDDPTDQTYIQNGIDYYNNGY